MSGNDFFTRLKRRREKFGLLQKDLASKIGVSTNTVLSWEKDTFPKGDSLLSIAKVLECSVDWLLNGGGLWDELPSPKIDNNFGRRLYEARMVNTFSLDFVAEQLKVDTGAIRRYESGEIPDKIHLLTLSDIMQCSIDWLLTGIGQPPRGHVFDETIPPVTMPNGMRIEDSNVIELRYIDVIKDFEDKPYALELSSDLLSLEKLNQSAYRKVGAYIKGVADGVRMSSGVDDKSKVG